MTTLLIAKSKDGKKSRTCNARCYDAKGQKCTCICGGKNHGVGYTTALENVFNEPVSVIYPGMGFEIVSVPIQINIFQEYST